MSLSVEERLRRYADDLDVAAAACASSTVDQSTSNVAQFDVITRSRIRPRQRRLLLAAATLLLIAGAVTVLVQRDSRERTASYPALGSHWVVPGPISGYHLWYAQSLNEGLGNAERYRVLVAQPSDAGFINPVSITIGEKWRLWADETNTADYQVDLIEVGGTTGEFVEDSINRTLVLQYELSNGDAVILGMRNPIPGSRQILLDLAGIVVPTDAGTLVAPPDLTDGYQVLAAMNMRHFFGTAPLLSFIDDDTRQTMINIESEAATPPPSYELFKMQETLERVDVRGVAGWFTVSHGPSTKEIGGTVFWREPSGEVITVSGSNGPNPTGRSALKAELLRIANDLRSVSESEWQDLAVTADSTGAGVGELAGPTQVAFPTTPDGYQLKSAELQPVGDQYGVARYVPIDPSSGLPIIEIRLHNLSPEDWDRMLATELAGRERMQANGRMLIDGGTGPGAETANQRSAAFEWVTNVVVEIVVSMPDGSPPTATFADLAELANQLNGVTIFNRYGSAESPSSSGEGPSTTLAAEETSQPFVDDPGIITFATTDHAITMWPTLVTSADPANNRGYGMVLCDDSVWTKFASLEADGGLSHSYVGTLCTTTTLNEVAVGSVATCAAVNAGVHYARCQRIDDTETGVPAGHPDSPGTTTVDRNGSQMGLQPSPTDAELTFGATVSAAGSAVAYSDGTVNVSLSAGEGASSTCFEIAFATFSSSGCLAANLLSTGLAYGAFQDGDGPIELVGIVPDDVATLEVAGVVITVRNNVWHFTALTGTDLNFTVSSLDASRSASVG